MKTNSQRQDGEPLRFISVGRLIHLKGYHMSLHAFAEVLTAFPDATYSLVGDGPERKKLAILSRSLGIEKSVHFLGKIQHSQVRHALAQHDVLLHPCLHDSGGCACLEAMAVGLPVIHLDIGGPTVLLSKDSGIEIPAHDPQQTVKGIAAAMYRFATDRSLLRLMGEAAKKRAREYFGWNVKGDRLQSLYARVMGTEKT